MTQPTSVASAPISLAPKRICLWLALEDTVARCTGESDHHCLVWQQDTGPVFERTAIPILTRKRSIYKCRLCETSFTTYNWGPEAFEPTTGLQMDKHGLGGQAQLKTILCQICPDKPDIVIVPLSRRTELLAWIDGYECGSKNAASAAK